MIIDNELATIKINGESFYGIGYDGLMTVNTKTYVESPSRSSDGSISNINDYVTFIVPRCKVNFRYFTIEDYQRLCRAITSNEFIVEYFDKQLGVRVSYKMYAEPEEMTKLYNVGTSVIGVLDYEVSFVATLNDLDYFTIKYDANGGTLLNYIGIYDSGTTYTYGNRIKYADIYYEANYRITSFLGIALSNTTYWELQSVSAYNAGTSYTAGNIVSSAGKCYLSIENSVGQDLTNTNYWEELSVSTYASGTTYYLGNYATDGINLYKAIYDLKTFSNQTPPNTTYWLPIDYLNGVEYVWGNSLIIEEATDYFTAPTGKTFVGYNSKSDGTGWWYYPNQSINIFENVICYAIWE